MTHAYIVSIVHKLYAVNMNLRETRFAERVRELREERKLSKRAFAKILGLNEASYRLYEKGECEPRLAMVVGIAEYFGVTTDYLLGVVDV